MKVKLLGCSVETTGGIFKKHPDGINCVTMNTDQTIIKAFEYHEIHDNDSLRKLVTRPSAILIEGNHFSKNLVFHGPFRNYQDAISSVIAIQLAHDVYVVQIEEEGCHFVMSKAAIYDTNVTADAQVYHIAMQNHSDTKRNHGRTVAVNHAQREHVITAMRKMISINCC